MSAIPLYAASPIMEVSRVEEAPAVYRSQPFIKLMRNLATEQLLRFPNAWALLSLIALRAQRSDSGNSFGLREGQAMIGDYAAVGLSRQKFRTALDQLKEWGFVTTKTTTKGTIATLCNSAIYDVNLESNNHQNNQPATNQQPADNQKTTTNKKKEKRKEGTMSDSASASPDEQGLYFADFWNAYQRKEGNKEKMNKQWDALTLPDRTRIMSGLAKYRQAKTVNGPQFMPLPQTFLNGKYWKSESYGDSTQVNSSVTPTPSQELPQRGAETPGQVLVFKGTTDQSANRMMKSGKQAMWPTATIVIL